MSGIYEHLRKRAGEIAARLPKPALYKDFEKEREESKFFLKSDPVVSDIKRQIFPTLENDFGHGLLHAETVTQDSGLLVLVEGRKAGREEDEVGRLLRLVQSAGLLHDIKRKHKEHALMGSCYAEEFLKPYPFEKYEIEDICIAIRNHEAFKRTLPLETAEGKLISDALYDGDKFRWGPDNFTHTVWDMLAFAEVEPEKFFRAFPQGMGKIEKIKETFRTATGKKYGPGFIDAGLTIGWELYREMEKKGFQRLV